MLQTLDGRKENAENNVNRKPQAQKHQVNKYSKI